MKTMCSKGSSGVVRPRTYDPRHHDPGGSTVTRMQSTEAEELLLIEEADAWFEYGEAIRGQTEGRYHEIEQLAREGAQAEPRADGGSDLGEALAGIELQPVRLVEQQEHPHLVEREYGQISAGYEHRRADDPVLARERRDDPVAHRAA